MFSSKQLKPEQISTIKEWASQGAQLPEIQRRIIEEMDYPVTYMDTRFLVLDLGIELIVEKEPEPEQIPEVVESALPPEGGTHVTMDAIPQPGYVVSGKVTFSDGEQGIWSLDETGRPTLDFNTIGYQPSREDIIEFQQQLRALIEKSGL
jgi:hypothetical protein